MWWKNKKPGSSTDISARAEKTMHAGTFGSMCLYQNAQHPHLINIQQDVLSWNVLDTKTSIIGEKLWFSMENPPIIDDICSTCNLARNQKLCTNVHMTNSILVLFKEPSLGPRSLTGQTKPRDAPTQGLWQSHSPRVKVHPWVESDLSKTEGSVMVPILTWLIY